MVWERCMVGRRERRGCGVCWEGVWFGVVWFGREVGGRERREV